jgi:outer membrane protein assembly factor BamB
MRSALLLVLVGCQDYTFKGHANDGDPGDTDTTVTTDPFDDLVCDDFDVQPRECGVTDACDFAIGDFNPIVEWTAGQGMNSTALPTVGDLDHDGMPEIVGNFTTGLGLQPGKLVVLHGDGSGIVWSRDAQLGYGSATALGDLDGDGYPEIVGVKAYDQSVFGLGDYTAVAYDALGTLMWESEHFDKLDFDYATAPAIADMDHDGSPEVIFGRVILNADGTTRGVGLYGHGSYGITGVGNLTVCESAVPAVVDLDLDGAMEVIVGDARYDADGYAVWKSSSQEDAMIGIANLDADPEGEIVACTGNTVRALDTSGAVMWGPKTIQGANILSPPAIGDLDGDGVPEIIVAGGNKIDALHADGTLLWENPITDESGATGASIFDFEGDGIPEVVYIDEIEMIAFDGPTGAVVFLSDEHASNTMMDYPVIADVDADGHAEIVVAHMGFGVALSVYGDRDDTWAPARGLWNQHAYSITNVNDDLSIPQDETPGFTTFNRWHSAIDRGASELVDDVEGEIVGTCEDDCDAGVMRVVGRLLNRSSRELPAGVPVSLYADTDDGRVLVGTKTTVLATPSGTTGEPMEFEVDAGLAADARQLWLQADDAGTGGGVLSECSETNNGFVLAGPFCQ